MNVVSVRPGERHHQLVDEESNRLGRHACTICGGWEGEREREREREGIRLLRTLLHW
jgi:hypothetical protein